MIKRKIPYHAPNRNSTHRYRGAEKHKAVPVSVLNDFLLAPIT
jgi:hypothetical protein